MTAPAEVLDQLRAVVAARLRCECWHGPSLEFFGDPCPRCELEQLIEGADRD